MNHFMENLNEIFTEIKSILENQSEGFSAMEEVIGSKAKNKKPGYHLYGTKEVSLFGKKPQQTYVAGVIQQKNYVSFYLMPIYSHPELIKDVIPELKKYLKGKSCFNIKKSSGNLLKNVTKVLNNGIRIYREMKWI